MVSVNIPAANVISTDPLQDRLARASKQAPGTLPVVDENPTAPSALPTPDSYTFFKAWGEKSNWKNEVTVKRQVDCFSPRGFQLDSHCHSIEAMREYFPSAHIHRIAPTPLLMTVAESDVLTPTDLALEAYSRAREPKQLQILPGGHFDGYSGPNFERNAGTQTDFLKRYLCS